MRCSPRWSAPDRRSPSPTRASGGRDQPGHTTGTSVRAVPGVDGPGGLRCTAARCRAPGVGDRDQDQTGASRWRPPAGGVGRNPRGDGGDRPRGRSTDAATSDQPTGDHRDPFDRVIVAQAPTRVDHRDDRSGHPNRDTRPGRRHTSPTGAPGHDGSVPAGSGPVRYAWITGARIAMRWSWSIVAKASMCPRLRATATPRRCEPASAKRSGS